LTAGLGFGEAQRDADQQEKQWILAHVPVGNSSFMALSSEDVGPNRA
jgi:hypothetical protein